MSKYYIYNRVELLIINCIFYIYPKLFIVTARLGGSYVTAFHIFLSLFLSLSYAKDLIKDTIQRNASPVRLEQSTGGEKAAMGGSSSSLNSSASDESNRLQQQNQQHNSRLRSSLLHSLSTNDASIGEYKYTVTVGNQSLKITGCNLDLVRVIIKSSTSYDLSNFIKPNERLSLNTDVQLNVSI